MRPPLLIDASVLEQARTHGGVWAKHFCAAHVVSRFQLDNAVGRLEEAGLLVPSDRPRVRGWIYLQVKT